MICRIIMAEVSVIGQAEGRGYNTYLVRRYVVVAANPVNTDTEGTTESVPINEESLLSDSCY